MNHGLLLAVSIAASLIGGLDREDAVRVEGVVLDPAGTPVRAAQVMATTKCGLLVLDQVGSAQTDDQGKFVLKIVPEHCGSVMLSAWKNDDFWLESGHWENVLENPGTAPVIDLMVTRSDPIVIHLGSRGGKLSIETTDEDNSFWPSVIFVNRCRSNGSASSTGWSFTSVESPTSEHLLPEGSYCVGIVSANGMFPITPTCTKVEVVAGQRRQITLMIDPLTLTTEAVPQERGCPSQSEIENSAPARPAGDARRTFESNIEKILKGELR